MFSEVDLLFILGPALLVIFLMLVILNARLKSKKLSDLDIALIRLKYSAIAFGALLLLLLFSLPSTPSLSTFGYPEITEQINSDTKILNYLQDYNRAIVRTTQVVHWAIFLFIFFFITAILSVAKNLQTNQIRITSES